MDLYINQSVYIRASGDLTEYTKIQRSVYQGCVMSIDLFNNNIELILIHSATEKELSKGEHNTTNLRYTYDTALLVKSEQDSKKLL